MIKIVSNIKKRLAVFLLSALLIGQGSGYLAQKLMVENNIRERIKDLSLIHISEPTRH